jgi:hypothetical protein
VSGWTSTNAVRQWRQTRAKTIQKKRSLVLKLRTPGPLGRLQLLPQGEVLQHQFVVSAEGYRHSAPD